MKRLCTILAILAAMTYASSQDVAEQERATAEYCKMVRLGYWPAYRDDVACPARRGRVQDSDFTLGVRNEQ